MKRFSGALFCGLFAGFVMVVTMVLGACSESVKPVSQRAGASPRTDLIAGSPDFTSGLRVPAGEVFYLGGGQKDGFGINVLNEGTQTVVLLEKTDGAQKEVAVVKPGERLSYRFASRAAALIDNTANSSEATLQVDVFGGDFSLPMYYEKGRK